MYTHSRALTQVFGGGGRGDGCPLLLLVLFIYHITSRASLSLSLSLSVCVSVYIGHEYTVDGMTEGQLAENTTTTSGRNSATTSSASKPKKGKDKKLNQAKLELANANRQLIQIRFKSTLIVR